LGALESGVMGLGLLATSLIDCHPEQSEGPAVRREKQILRFAQDDKAMRVGTLAAGFYIW